MLAGIFEIAAGTRLRRHIQDEWLLIAGGIGSLGFGSFLGIFDTQEIVPTLHWICWYALVSGVAIGGLVIRLQSMRVKIHALPH